MNKVITVVIAISILAPFIAAQNDSTRDAEDVKSNFIIDNINKLVDDFQNALGLNEGIFSKDLGNLNTGEFVSLMLVLGLVYLIIT